MKIAPSCADAVDVGRLTDHQAAVIDARLHPADVVAHDEEDVGFLCLLPSRGWRVSGSAACIDKPAPISAAVAASSDKPLWNYFRFIVWFSVFLFGLDSGRVIA